MKLLFEVKPIIILGTYKACLSSYLLARSNELSFNQKSKRDPDVCNHLYQLDILVLGKVLEMM